MEGLSLNGRPQSSMASWFEIPYVELECTLVSLCYMRFILCSSLTHTLAAQRRPHDLFHA